MQTETRPAAQLEPSACVVLDAYGNARWDAHGNPMMLAVPAGTDALPGTVLVPLHGLIGDIVLRLPDGAPLRDRSGVSLTKARVLALLQPDAVGPRGGAQPAPAPDPAPGNLSEPRQVESPGRSGSGAQGMRPGVPPAPRLLPSRGIITSTDPEPTSLQSYFSNLTSMSPDLTSPVSGRDAPSPEMPAPDTATVTRADSLTSIPLAPDDPPCQEQQQPDLSDEPPISVKTPLPRPGEGLPAGGTADGCGICVLLDVVGAPRYHGPHPALIVMHPQAHPLPGTALVAPANALPDAVLTLPDGVSLGLDVAEACRAAFRQVAPQVRLAAVSSCVPCE